MRDWIMKNRWLAAVLGSILAGIVVLLWSWWVGTDSWWSGTLVNAGTALVLFAPLLMFGRKIERRFDEVRASQAQIEQQQDATSASIAALADEVSSTQAELRRTREELNVAVAARLTAVRERDRKVFADVEDAPSRAALFSALVRAAELHLTTSTGCRVRIDNTSLYLWFETPTPHDRFEAEPDPDEDLYVRLEDISGGEVGRLSWPKSHSPEDFLVAVSEAVIKAGHYPGDRLFDAGRLLSDLRELLDLTYRSATGGSFEPLTEVIEYCAPQWVVTQDALVSVHNGYSISLVRIHEDWSTQMSGKPWLDRDSFDAAFEAGRALCNARRKIVKSAGRDEEPPF